MHAYRLVDVNKPHTHYTSIVVRTCLLTNDVKNGGKKKERQKKLITLTHITPQQTRLHNIDVACRRGNVHRGGSSYGLCPVDVGDALQQHLHHIDVASLRESRNEKLCTVRTVRFAVPPCQQPQDHLQARLAKVTVPPRIGMQRAALAWMRTSGKDHETAQAMHPRLAFGAAFCSFATGRTRVQPFTSHVCKLA